MNRSFFLFFSIWAFNLYYLVPSSSATPIIGGITDEYHTFKHDVSLHSISKPLHRYKYFCGGSIVSEKHILTAARCFMSDTGYHTINLEEGRPKIIAGTKLRDGPGMERHIFKVFIPNIFIPTATGKDGNGDISVVELTRNLDVSQKIYPISIVNMLDLEPQYDADRNAMFPGFGATNRHDKLAMSNIRHYLPIVLRSKRDCPGDDSIICANSHENQVKTACHGDRGSGLSVHGGIIGVLNFGPLNCNTNAEPIIFTRIEAFSSFISNAMNPLGNHSDLQVYIASGESSSSRSGHSRYPRFPSAP